MINKILFLMLSISILSTSSREIYNGGTLAPVILAGSVVKHLGTEIATKYKRKDCPICKGTGKYLSGDGIKMVDCGYCEPETKQLEGKIQINPHCDNNKCSIKKCNNPNCKCKECKCKNCGC
jgi:hypothetical protein